MYSSTVQEIWTTLVSQVPTGTLVSFKRRRKLTIDEAPHWERYCVDSGRPVHMIGGDRCLSHGDQYEPCFTSIRIAKCKHPNRSPNHPRPHCAECGLDLEE